MKRFRRLKSNSLIRNMVKDLYIDKDSLVYPLFVIEGFDIKEEISSMPGQFRFSPDRLLDEVSEIKSLGLKSILLFGIPETKDEKGSSSYADNGVIQNAVRMIKEKFDDLIVITDLCMCEYTSHGHCGILHDKEVANDETLEVLAKIAVSQAKAGADIIAPSDMMDGRIKVIRDALDCNGFINVPIMSYSVKFASAYYGPFREAAGSAPSFGDRKTYQMDYRRSGEYFDKVCNDISEGADIIMVKPALSYLDVVKDLSGKIDLPIAVYNVSGEYSMVKLASTNGLVDYQSIVMENMYAFRRAGADIIITYHAKDIAKWLGESK